MSGSTIWCQYLGHSLPLLGTEAGYGEVEPEPTLPPIDLQRHAAYNVEILRNVGPHGSRRWRDCLFCQCMWLVDGFGHRDFSEAAWHNNRQWAGGGNLPAVGAMRSEWAARPFVRRFGWEEPMATYGYSERGGAPVLAVVWHGAESHNIKKCCYARERERFARSAHYAIERDGRIDAIVPEDKAAWHCGGSTIPGWTGDPNRCTIGIELAATRHRRRRGGPGADDGGCRSGPRTGQALRVGAQRHVPAQRHRPAQGDPRNLDWPAFLDPCVRTG